MFRRPATLGLMLALPLFACAQGQGATEPRSITVTGTAVVRIVPDEVEISFRIESVNPDLRKSVAETDARVQKLLGLTREFKIDARDVQTRFVNIQSKWDREGKKFLGFESSSGTLVTLRDVSRYSEFVARAVETAEVLLDGISFETTKETESRADARRMALQAAHKKAIAMAGELGESIGPPLSIVEVSGGAGEGSNFYSNYQVAAEGPGAPIDVATVAPGQIEVYARVQVRFELASLRVISTSQPTGH